MNEKITIYIDGAGEFRWRVQAANERVVADSGEGYQHLSDCQDEAKKLFPELEIAHDFVEQE